MANRHLSRIIIVQALYEWDFRRDSDVEAIARRGIDTFANEVDEDFVVQTVKGVVAQSDELDKLISEYAPEWPLEQIAVIDKTLLRASVYELIYIEGTPPKVVINEAVELSKMFGGEGSAKFINGVLGSIYRTHPKFEEDRKTAEAEENSKKENELQEDTQPLEEENEN
jgi:transcription antitermination protein NusB